jgi:hypothetical protein
MAVITISVNEFPLQSLLLKKKAVITPEAELNCFARLYCTEKGMA